jgi:CheY-like chemotaxis protein
MATAVVDCPSKDMFSTFLENMSRQALPPLREPGKRQPGILVVDDDPEVRTLLNVLLNEDGYAVWLTANGYQAIKAYRGHRQDIDLVLMDVRMPGLDGPQTLAALHEFNPQLRCCFMTGAPGRYTEQDLLDRGPSASCTNRSAFPRFARFSRR